VSFTVKSRVTLADGKIWDLVWDPVGNVRGIAADPDRTLKTNHFLPNLSHASVDNWGLSCGKLGKVKGLLPSIYISLGNCGKNLEIFGRLYLVVKLGVSPAFAPKRLIFP
jgi:hypothetical protein